MITRTTPSGTVLQLYASTKEMPIKLHNLSQRYLLLDMGIGSDMGAIDDHFKSLDAFLHANKMQEAIQERENQRFAFYTMLEQVNYKSLTFACHIFSINGEPVIDRSEEAMNEMVNGLDISMLDIEEILTEVKKNFSMN